MPKKWTRGEVDPLLKEIIRKQIGNEVVEERGLNDNTNLWDDLDYDSLDVLETIMEIEEQLDLELSNEEAEKMGFVYKDILDHICERLDVQ